MNLKFSSLRSSKMILQWKKASFLVDLWEFGPISHNRLLEYTSTIYCDRGRQKDPCSSLPRANGPGYIRAGKMNPRHTLVPAMVAPTGGNAPTGSRYELAPLPPPILNLSPIPHDRAMRSQLRWWRPTISLTKEILRKHIIYLTFQDGSLIEAALSNYFLLSCHCCVWTMANGYDQNRT